MRCQITSRMIGQADLEEILATAYNTGRTRISLFGRDDGLLFQFDSFNYGRAYHEVQQLLLDGVWRITCACPGHSASEEGRKPEYVDATRVALNVAAWAATGTPFLR